MVGLQIRRLKLGNKHCLTKCVVLSAVIMHWPANMFVLNCVYHISSTRLINSIKHEHPCKRPSIYLIRVAIRFTDYLEATVTVIVPRGVGRTPLHRFSVDISFWFFLNNWFQKNVI